MENRAHALIAGLFTLILGAAAVASLWWFGGKQELTQDYLVVTTKNVTGLNPQAQVRYRGVRVGRVQSIELDPNDFSKTLIQISIRREIPITGGVTAKLGFQGVTGIAHVLLEESGKNPALLQGEGGGLPRIAMQDSLIQELADVGGDVLRHARELLVNVNQVFNAENRQSLARTLANVESTTGQASEALVELRRVLAGDTLRRFNRILEHAEQTSAQTAPLLIEARGLVSRLSAVSEKIDNTLGDPANGPSALMPRFSELAGELASSSRQLGRVLQQLEESPQSLLFGRATAEPGPGEAGFVVPAQGVKP